MTPRCATPVDVTDVEALRGVVEDVAATHGYLICPNGYSEAAERRAQESVSIRLLPLEFLDNFDPSGWPECMAPGCANGLVFWDGYPEIGFRAIFISALASATPRRLSFVHYVEKCDRCGRFHVKCLTCGEILTIPHDDDADIGRQCACKMPWLWIASVEQAEDGAPSAELHAVLFDSRVITAGRRPLA